MKRSMQPSLLSPHSDGDAQERFERDSLGFLVGYAARNRGRPFGAEEVTTAAIDAGLTPRDLRNWGPVFREAERAGYIRRSTEVFERKMGNGTKALGWISV